MVIVEPSPRARRPGLTLPARDCSQPPSCPGTDSRVWALLERGPTLKRARVSVGSAAYGYSIHSPKLKTYRATVPYVKGSSTRQTNPSEQINKELLVLSSRKPPRRLASGARGCYCQRKYERTSPSTWTPARQPGTGAQTSRLAIRTNAGAITVPDSDM